MIAIKTDMHRYLIYYWSDDGVLQLIPATLTLFDNNDTLEIVASEFNIDKLNTEIELETALDYIYMESLRQLKEQDKSKYITANISHDKKGLLRKITIAMYKPYYNEELEKRIKEKWDIYKIKSSDAD